MGFEDIVIYNNPADTPFDSKETARLLDESYRQNVSRLLDNQREGKTLEEIEENSFLKKEYIQYGKYSIDFLRVLHTPETIFKHEEEILDSIQTAQYLITETMNPALYIQKAYKKLEKSFFEPLQEGEKVESARSLKGPFVEGEDFYGAIADMAALHKKPIMVFDPIGDERVNTKEYHRGFWEQESSLELWKAETSEDIAKLGIGIFGATLAADVMSRLFGNGSEKSISRRQFLTQGGMAVAAAALPAHFWLDNNSDSDDFTTFRYELVLDYRDLCIALGIMQMEALAAKPTKIAMIYGTNHFEGVQYYLQNPHIAKTKINTLYRDVVRDFIPMTAVYEFKDNPNKAKKWADSDAVVTQSLGQWEKILEARTKI